ncbi:AAA family ATPase [Actinomadura graeca]|uniref:AAA family ATPase n=1 Tax=Actinomadura graeca TaxID=2750812 RepID=A0ABX8QSE9_9ACTN|nr:NB-ARC domain-containing protein [Actinomadura graeca]QXJ21311.1 AAA family ATPase [Actinomadura graeca]
MAASGGLAVVRRIQALRTILPFGAAEAGVPATAYLVPRELPPAPPVFVGRADEIRRLRDELPPARRSRTSIAIIHGPGGIGKSALAITFAHQVAGKFHDGQLYIRVWAQDGPPDLTERILEKFVRALKKPEDEMPSGEAALRKRYAELTSGRVLIVLDDVGPEFDLTPLLPSGPRSLLIATCPRRPRLAGSPATDISLMALRHDEALDLLRTTIGAHRVDNELDQSEALARQCQGQPLALRMAGTALASRPNWALQLVLAQSPHPAGDPLSLVRRGDDQEPRWFDAVYALLTRNEQAALGALYRLERPLFTPRMLGQALGTDERHAGRLAARLADAGLVERYNPSSAATSYRVEETVLRYAALLRGTPERHRMRWGRPGGRTVGLLPRPAHGRIRGLDELLWEHRGFTLAIYAMREAMGAAREDGDRAEEALACGALAELYAELGELLVAEDLAYRALNDAASITQARRCLSRIERHRNRPDAAVGHASEAVKMARALENRPEQVRALLADAMALCVRGAADDAINALQSCIEARRHCEVYQAECGHLTPAVLWTYARVLSLGRDHPAASKALDEAAEHIARSGRPSPYTAWIGHLRAVIAIERLEHEDAERHALQSLDAFTQLRHRFGMAHCHYELGRLYLRTDRARDAVRVLRQAVETFSNCGDLLIWTHARMELALAYEARARFGDSRRLLRAARRSYVQLGYAPGWQRVSQARHRTRLWFVRPGKLRLFLERRRRRRHGDGGAPRRRLLPRRPALRLSPWRWAVLAGLPPALALPLLLPDQWLRLTALGLGLSCLVLVPLRNRRPPAVPVARPQRIELPSFHGREEQLREFTDLHDARRRNPPPGTPLILAIHGPPGVGKTALAQQLALRIGPHYGKWQLFANMGTAGGPRPPRDVLYDLLRQLGRSKGELKGLDAQSLAGMFRAMTVHRDMLIVLDAARSLEQVLAVLPGESGCTVIITSRAGFMAGRAQHTVALGVPSEEEATRIFRWSADTDDPPPPHLVAEAVELCGRQTNALRVAADRSRRHGLEPTLAHLRDEGRRLEFLRYGGRDVAERFESEYADLEQEEREALLLLTIPESRTFVPWVLQPLLGIGSDQAGNLMTSISRVGLLDIEGQDVAGFARYHLSPLMRLFARRQIARGDISRERLALARTAFRRAYLAGSLRVLAKLGIPEIQPPWSDDAPDHWFPEIPGWDSMIAEHLRSWVRAEFGNLVRTVHEAHRLGEHAACRHIAARIGDCYASPVRHQTVREAFALAVESARAEGSVEGEIDVRIARAGYLTTVTDYPMAIGELRALEEMPLSGARRVEVGRRLGHALHEIGLHREADEAVRAVSPTDAHAEVGAEGLLLCAVHHEARAGRGTGHGAGRWVSGASVPDLGADEPPASRILAGMLEARRARRRRDVTAAERALEAARRLCREELADGAALDGERVELYLHCRTPGPRAHGRPPEAEDVTVLAGRAVRSFDRIGRPIGRVRARLAYARALLYAGQADECVRQLDDAQRILCEVPDVGARRQAAGLAQIRGEVLLRLGERRAALASLEGAGRWFAEHEPYSYAVTLSLLGETSRRLGDLSGALARYRAAERLFAQHGDEVAARAMRRCVFRTRLARRTAPPGRVHADARRPGDGAPAPAPATAPAPAPAPAGELPGLTVAVRREDGAAMATGEDLTLDVDVRWRDGAGADRVPGGLRLRTIVLAGDLPVSPASATATLTPDGIDRPLAFSFIPGRPGALAVSVKVYEARTGFLLHEVTGELDIRPGARASTPQ